MEKDVLYSEFIELLKTKVYGRSTTYLCGWLKLNDIKILVEELENEYKSNSR